jgi:hypothetical protein
MALTPTDATRKTLLTSGRVYRLDRPRARKPLIARIRRLWSARDH